MRYLDQKLLLKNNICVSSPCFLFSLESNVRRAKQTLNVQKEFLCSLVLFCTTKEEWEIINMLPSSRPEKGREPVFQMVYSPLDYKQNGSEIHPPPPKMWTCGLTRQGSWGSPTMQKHQDIGWGIVSLVVFTGPETLCLLALLLLESRSEPWFSHPPASEIRKDNIKRKN